MPEGGPSIHAEIPVTRGDLQRDARGVISSVTKQWDHESPSELKQIISGRPDLGSDIAVKIRMGITDRFKNKNQHPDYLDESRNLLQLTREAGFSSDEVAITERNIAILTSNDGDDLLTQEGIGRFFASTKLMELQPEVVENRVVYMLAEAGTRPDATVMLQGQDKTHHEVPLADRIKHVDALAEGLGIEKDQLRTRAFAQVQRQYNGRTEGFVSMSDDRRFVTVARAACMLEVPAEQRIDFFQQEATSEQTRMKNRIANRMDGYTSEKQLQAHLDTIQNNLSSLPPDMASELAPFVTTITGPLRDRLAKIEQQRQAAIEFTKKKVRQTREKLVENGAKFQPPEELNGSMLQAEKDALVEATRGKAAGVWPVETSGFGDVKEKFLDSTSGRPDMVGNRAFHGYRPPDGFALYVRDDSFGKGKPRWCKVIATGMHQEGDGPYMYVTGEGLGTGIRMKTDEFFSGSPRFVLVDKGADIPKKAK